MQHLVAHSLEGTLLVRNHVECEAAWACFHRHIRIVASVIMHNHVHILSPDPPGDVADAFRAAMSGFARWRNCHRGECGPVWMRMPDPEPVNGRRKIRRNIRYIALNPVREGLVATPLRWPWSSHRDAVALSHPAQRPPVRDPGAHHSYVSSDPSVRVDGTVLPPGIEQPLHGPQSLEVVQAAVSEVMRVPLPRLRQRGVARTALMRAARVLTTCSTREIAEFVGLTPRAVRSVEIVTDPVVRAVGRVAGDPRFPGLHDLDFRDLPGWERFRHHH